MSALDIRGVTVKRSTRTVLDAVSVTLAAGRFTAVIGPNGAGKSTLLAVAARMMIPESGEIRLGASPIASLSRRDLARRRAYLPQRAGVEWPITVERVVALGLIPSLPSFGGLPAALLPAVEEAMTGCDILPLRDRPATGLSGGELARVMLARAIVGDPELLIVDEPTAGLDPRHAIDAMRRLQLRAAAGRTVVMAVHDLDLALNHADDLVAIREGRILAAGRIDTVATADLLTALYDVPVRLIRDHDGYDVRFLASLEAP